MEPNQEQFHSAIKTELVTAFHWMWDAFPTHAMLVTRDRTIQACNHAAAARGLRPGMKCFQLSADRIHKHCKANAALEEGAGQQTVVYSQVTKRVNNSFWLPIEGEKDLFVHVVIDISSYAKPELFQP